jgi:hypothetical protein
VADDTGAAQRGLEGGTMLNATEARRVLAALAATEVDGSLEPQARRVLQDLADGLRRAIGLAAGPGHRGEAAARAADLHPQAAASARDARVALDDAVAEARRVAAMWGVTI